MKKRLLAIFLLAALMLTLFAACGGDKGSMLSAEDAQKVVLKDLDVSAKQVSDIHTHTAMQDNIPCYNIHVTLKGVEYEYLINARTGDIIKKAP